jgi:hypothetical protein
VPPRGAAQQSGKKVQCYEPATMKYLGYVPALTPDEVCAYCFSKRLMIVMHSLSIWQESSQNIWNIMHSLPKLASNY